MIVIQSSVAQRLHPIYSQAKDGRKKYFPDSYGIIWELILDSGMARKKAKAEALTFGSVFRYVTVNPNQ